MEQLGVQGDMNVGLGLLFMLGSIFCSVIITFILKHHALRNGSRIVVLANNYIVAVVLLSTLGVYLIWREKLNRTGWIALGLAVLAIALMNLRPAQG